MKLELKLNKNQFWIILLSLIVIFSSFVIASITTPSHNEEDVLIEIPSYSQACNAGEIITLKEAIDNRCIMDDGQDGIPYDPSISACRICKNGCGGTWSRETAMFRPYMGPVQGQPNPFDAGNDGGDYKYYNSNCGGSLQYSSSGVLSGEVELYLCCTF